MGTTIDCWIEYDEHGNPPFSQSPEVLPLDHWYDLRGAKDYDVFGAISGIRNTSGIEPLFKLRGLPPNPSRIVEEYVDGDDSQVGWLDPDEVRGALSHQNVTQFISLEMRCVLNALEFFSREIGNDRVRFVFYIE